MPPGAPSLEYGTQVTTDGDASGQGPGPDRVDPVYDALFRTEDVRPPVEPPTPPPIAEAPIDSPAPTPGADTGRLFRSQGVEGHGETVLALDAGRFSRLRTLDRVADEPARGEAPVESSAEDIAVASLLAPPPAPIPMPQGEAVTPSDSRHRGSRRSPGLGRGSLRAGGVYLIVIGVTLIIGFANALLGGGSLGWPTGVALLISSIYAAISVRREDDTSAFLIPPVAFLLAALTAGQLFLDANEGSILNRAVIVFFSLADNWLWIIGSTLIALVIVLVRRRRG